MNKVATFDLTVTRFIRAPREKVYDAFVKPEILKLWYGPRGMTIPEAALDARVGGRYRITMRARDGETHVVAGEYLELQRPARIVHTWTPEGGPVPRLDTLVTITFTEADGGTEVRLVHTGFPDGGIRDGHNDGWNSVLNCLVDHADERGTAASLTVIGDPRSSYVRTLRMGLHEKGLKYALQVALPHTPEVTAIHPFGRIPAFRDNHVTLFETSAILRYVEESFPGPSLLAGNARLRAVGEQWTSAINAYLYPCCVQRYVAKYLFAKDGKPDREAIDGALKEMPGHFAALDRAYGMRDVLAGNAVSMPDLFLAPILFYVEQMPEGRQLLLPHANLMRAQSAIRARESFRATAPS